MTFDTDERSASGNRPIELVTLASPSGTHHVTSHNVDVNFGGVIYTALTMDRDNLQVAQDLTGRELVIRLPISHPVVQRYTTTGIPERELLVTLVRLQSTSSEAFQQASGFGGGLSIEGRLAAIRVPSLTDDAMKVRVPTVRAQRLCNHVLYDTQCLIVRGLFLIGTTIVSQSGNTLVVASMGGQPDNFATFGELLHLVTDQRPMILSQIGATLTLDRPLVGALTGDIVSVFAGCDHSLTACHEKFNNVANFGGMPALNNGINPRVPPGFGIIQQV